MTAINRNPGQAAGGRYDLVIIGGGVSGIMLLLEASRRGLKPLLLEAADFGGRTSFNHLRILHGGLRYLQTMDLPRFRESVAERQWYLKHFPRFVRPLACLMPLYRGGILQAPLPMQSAFLLNDLLSRGRNDGLPAGRRIPAGRIAGPEEVVRLFPGVRQEGMRGGALWHDAFIPHSPRLLINLVRWSCRLGAAALNYMQAMRLSSGPRGSLGVEARDSRTGEVYTFFSRAVVNAAGPWCREVAASLDRDKPALFRGGLLWNLLLDRDAVSQTCAVAVSPPVRRARTYFLVPWRGKLLAGTGHASWNGRGGAFKPSSDHLAWFLEDINAAVPGIGLARADILHVFSGLMPVTATGGTRLTHRARFIDHGRQGGPTGLYSLCGTKFTTARSLAEKVIRQIFPGRALQEGGAPPEDLAQTRSACRGLFDFKRLPEELPPAWKEEVETICAEESVMCLEDLVFRRTTLWTDPAAAARLAPALARLTPWDEACRRTEIERFGRKTHPGQPVFTF